MRDGNLDGHVLVVGARKGSLGREVADRLDALGVSVLTAGLHDEDVPLDLSDASDIRRVLSAEHPTDIVCTVGVNAEHSIRKWDPTLFLQELLVNAALPMNLLAAWLTECEDTHQPFLPGHFIAVSSNSAHIARSKSVGYCASKAALSMALRCAARDLAGNGVLVYGYEFGWLSGTPMSSQVMERLDGLAPHRIPGGRDIDREAAADLIVRNLMYGGPELNGTMLRIDGGEQ